MRGRIKKLASFHHHLHPQEGITLSFLHMSPKSVHRYHCPHHLSKDSCVEKIPWRRDRLPTPLFLGFPCGSAGKESACNAGDLSLVPGLGRSPREGNSYPLQYSGLENCMYCIVHGVAKSWTQLSNFHFHDCAQTVQTCVVQWSTVLSKE